MDAEKFGLKPRRRLVWNTLHEIEIIQHCLEQQKSIVGLFDWHCLMRGKRSFNEWHYVEILQIKMENKTSIQLQYWNPNGGRQENIQVSLAQFKRSFWIYWSIA